MPLYPVTLTSSGEFHTSGQNQKRGQQVDDLRKRNSFPAARGGHSMALMCSNEYLKKEKTIGLDKILVQIVQKLSNEQR